MYHHSTPAVLSWGCATLQNLACFGVDGCAEIVKLGGAEAILTAMRFHPEDLLLQSAALIALHSLTCSSQEHAQFIFRLGGVEPAVRALQALPRSVEVQERGLALICALARASPESRAAVMSACGIAALHVALHAHMAEAGSKADSNVLVADEYCLQVQPPNSAQLVLDAMHTFPEDTTVQTAACLALRDLARGTAARQAEVVSLGGLDSVLDILRQQPRSLEVQRAGCKALHALALGSAAHEAKFMELRGMEVLLAAMASFPGEVELVEPSVLTLRLLLQGHPGAWERVPAEDVQPVLRVVSLNLGRPALLEECALVLTEVAAYGEVHQFMIATWDEGTEGLQLVCPKGVRMVCRIFEAHPTRNSLQVVAARCMTAIMRGEKIIARDFFTAGALDLLTRTLSTNVRNPAVLVPFFVAMETLVDSAKSNGVKDKAQAAQQMFIPAPQHSCRQAVLRFPVCAFSVCFRLGKS